MAAETSAGQANGKPEIKHEDDEHFRTEDSSCRGSGEKQISEPRTAPAEERGNTRLALHSGHVRDRDPGRALSAPEKREMNGAEAPFAGVSAVAGIGLVP